MSEAARHTRPLLSSDGLHTSESSALDVAARDIAALAAELAPLLAAELNPDRLLDDKGAAALLGVPASWVAAEARAKRIPHVRLGHYRRYAATSSSHGSRRASRDRGLAATQYRGEQEPHDHVDTGAFARRGTKRGTECPCPMSLSRANGN